MEQNEIFEERSLWNSDNKDNRAQNVFFTVIIIILSLIIIFFSLFSFCGVLGDSMLDGLQDGEVVLLVRSPSKVHRGDIVTIDNVSKDSIIKRVIGLEGDKIVFKIHHNNPDYVQLYINKGNGYVLMDEDDYIKESMTTYSFNRLDKFVEGEYVLAPPSTVITDFDKYSIEVGKDEFFFMGDNRNISKDSRIYGCRKKKNISGKMLLKI